VVVPGGSLRRGETDGFIGRGQERKRLRRCKGLRVNSSGWSESREETWRVVGWRVVFMRVILKLPGRAV
jgi:hypothetical protein